MSGAETVELTQADMVTAVGDAIAAKIFEESEVYWALERGTHIPGIVRDRIAEAAITAWNTRATQADAIAVMREAEGALDAVSGEEPINQDEQGGCVWCGGSARRSSYAGSDPKHHSQDCAWVIARTTLANLRAAIARAGGA